MKKATIISIGIVSFIIVSLPVTKSMIRYHMNPLEALLVIAIDVTHWAPNYSEKKFKELKIGDMEDQVRKALGPPLYVTDNGSGVVWYYTVGPNGQPLSYSDGSTHVRGVWYNHQKKIKKKLHYYYFD